MKRVDEETLRCEKCKTMRVAFNRTYDEKKNRSYMHFRCPKCGSTIKVRDEKPIMPSGSKAPIRKPSGSDMARWAEKKGYLNRMIMFFRRTN
jgi:predicted RNA-binding Zn-ribbon protein involved in translation (DUF1610 family)